MILAGRKASALKVELAAVEDGETRGNIQIRGLQFNAIGVVHRGPAEGVGPA